MPGRALGESPRALPAHVRAGARSRGRRLARIVACRPALDNRAAVSPRAPTSRLEVARARLASFGVKQRRRTPDHFHECRPACARPFRAYGLRQREDGPHQIMVGLQACVPAEGRAGAERPSWSVRRCRRHERAAQAKMPKTTWGCRLLGLERRYSRPIEVLRQYRGKVHEPRPFLRQLLRLLAIQRPSRYSSKWEEGGCEAWRQRIGSLTERGRLATLSAIT